jgi:SAM-dependent methyltransferase
MAQPDIVAAFDRISPVYDATRFPLDAPVMDRIAAALRGRGARSVLEVGVGTGRIAGPLSERRLEVTGVDASAKMLAEARRKQLDRLIRGSAYALPLRDRSVDAALFVHVLHLLDDPRAALREASRVSRTGVTALVRPRRDRTSDRPARGPDDPQRQIVAVLERMGHPLPAGSVRGEPHTREAGVIEAIPPDELEVIVDAEVTEPLADRLRMIEKGASRRFLHVPPDVLAAAVAEVRGRIGDRTRTFRRVEALATWSKAPPADGPAPVGREPPAL